MFHIKSQHSYLDLFEGIIIGGTLASAATFLFGTKKGKELQKELVHQYQKLGHATKETRKKIEKAITTQVAKKVKNKVKTKAKKALKKGNLKIKSAKRKISRKMT
jgi:gas vesicle protein